MPFWLPQVQDTVRIHADKTLMYTPKYVLAPRHQHPRSLNKLPTQTVQSSSKDGFLVQVHCHSESSTWLFSYRCDKVVLCHLGIRPQYNIQTNCNLGLGLPAQIPAQNWFTISNLQTRWQSELGNHLVTLVRHSGVNFKFSTWQVLRQL